MPTPEVVICRSLVRAALGKRLGAKMSERPVLDDAAFFDTYYASSGIPADIPIRTRMIIAEQLGKSWRGIRPADNIPQMDEEFDFADVMFEIAEEFGIRISLEDIQLLDGTFDSAVRYVASRRSRYYDPCPSPLVQFFPADAVRGGGDLQPLPPCTRCLCFQRGVYGTTSIGLTRNGKRCVTRQSKRNWTRRLRRW